MFSTAQNTQRDSQSEIEKRRGEGGDRDDLREKRENQKGREQSSQESIPYVHSIVWNTQRRSQSYIEKRRGRKEVEVTRRKRGGIKRRETDLSSNQFPISSPQSGTSREVHGVTERREEG